MKVNPVCQKVSGLRSGGQDETPPAAHRARFRLRLVMRSNCRNVDEQMALLACAVRGLGRYDPLPLEVSGPGGPE